MPTYRWSPRFSKDGSVSKREGQGERKGVQDRSRTQDLNRQQQARSTGRQRYQSHRAMTPRAMPRGGRMRRR